MPNINISQRDIDTWVSQVINRESNAGKSEQQIGDVRQNLENCLLKKKAVVKLQTLKKYEKQIGKIDQSISRIIPCKNFSTKKTRPYPQLSTDDNIFSNIGKHKVATSHGTETRSNSNKKLLSKYNNIKYEDKEPNNKLVSKDVPSTSMNCVKYKGSSNIFEKEENSAEKFSINLSLNFESCKKRKFIISCEECDERQWNKTTSKQKHKKSSSVHSESTKRTEALQISLLDEILNDDNKSEHLSNVVANSYGQSTSGLQLDTINSKKNLKRSSKSNESKRIKKQATSKRNTNKKTINDDLNNNNITSIAKSDLAKYVEHFSNNCDVGDLVTPVTTLIASPQLVTSSTENFEQPITYYVDSNFQLVPANENVCNPITSSYNSVTYANTNDGANQSILTNTPQRNVNIPLYMQNSVQQRHLDTFCPEPSMNSLFSSMSNQEMRTATQCVHPTQCTLPTTHSISHHTPQLSWSKEGVMMEKPLTEAIYKPLNLSNKIRDNGIAPQEERNEDTFDADDIIREVIKISKIDMQESLSDEIKDNSVSRANGVSLSMPLLDFDERHFDNFLDDITSNVIKPLENRDNKHLEGQGSTALYSGETTTTTNINTYDNQCENRDSPPILVFPQSLSDFANDNDLLKSVDLIQSENDVLNHSSNTSGIIDVFLPDIEENGTKISSAVKAQPHQSTFSSISTIDVTLRHKSNLLKGHATHSIEVGIDKHDKEKVKELINDKIQFTEVYQSPVVDSVQSIVDDLNDQNVQNDNDLSITGSANCSTLKVPKNLKTYEKKKSTVESCFKKDEITLLSGFSEESKLLSLSPNDDIEYKVALNEVQPSSILFDFPLLENEFRMETPIAPICNNESPENVKLKNEVKDITGDIKIQEENEKEDSPKMEEVPELNIKQTTDIDNTVGINVEISEVLNDGIILEQNKEKVAEANENIVEAKFSIFEVEKEDLTLSDDLEDVLSLAPSSIVCSPVTDHFMEFVMENENVSNDKLHEESHSDSPIPSMKAKKYIIPKLNNNQKKANDDKQRCENIKGCISINSLDNEQTASSITRMLPKNEDPLLLNSRKYEDITRTVKNELVLESVAAKDQKQQQEQEQLQKSPTQNFRQVLLNYPRMCWNNPLMNNLEDIFGVTCLLYLKGKCTSNYRCTLSHQFNSADIIVPVLRNLPSITLNSLYNYMCANICLYKMYFKYFCQFYAYSGNRYKLLNIVYDCERYPECASELINVYNAFICCGISKVNACRLILQRLQYTNSISIISELVNIIVDADWTMFTDYLKRLANDDVKYYFPINLLERMAVDVLRNPHTPLTRYLGVCMQKVQEHEVSFLLTSKKLMKCVKLLIPNA